MLLPCFDLAEVPAPPHLVPVMSRSRSNVADTNRQPILLRSRSAAAATRAVTGDALMTFNATARQRAAMTRPASPAAAWREQAVPRHHWHVITRPDPAPECSIPAGQNSPIYGRQPPDHA